MKEVPDSEASGMILLAESDNFDAFTDRARDLVHLDCYAQGITLHLPTKEFLELCGVILQARQVLLMDDEEGGTVQ